MAPYDAYLIDMLHIVKIQVDMMGLTISNYGEG